MTDNMTITEAIAEIKEMKKHNEFACTDDQCGLSEECADMAIEALEKQIPKKADGVYCNSCGWQVKKFHKVSGQYSGVADGYAYREEKHDYCESCGQAIDWESDTE